MNTNFVKCKAKVVNPYIRLNRTASEVSDKLYELDTTSLCRLTDALSKGNIMKYVIMDSNQEPVSDKTLMSMCNYLNDTLNEREKMELFGTGFYDGHDMYDYVSNSKAVHDANTHDEIKTFIDGKYSLENNQYVRKDFVYRNY